MLNTGNPCGSKQCPSRTAQPDVGPKYEITVATLVAATLSTKKQIQDYQIFFNLKEAQPFDDVVVKVFFKGEDTPCGFAMQVKHIRRGEKLKVEKYLDGYSNIKAGGLKTIGDIDINNVHFCYFCINDVETTKKYKLLPYNSTNEWWRRALPFQNCYKLSYEQINETDKEHKDFLDKFYMYFGQPKKNEIEERIKQICKIDNATDILGYVDRFFENDELWKRGLCKEIFQTELLKIRLSDHILLPSNIIQLNDLPVSIWNKLTLQYDVTIVKAEANIEKVLYGCLAQMLKHLLNKDVEWNEYKTTKSLDPAVISKFEDLFATNAPVRIRHWISAPTTLKALTIELWKCGELPLILKTEEELPVLNDYAHLNKKYIIITDELVSQREKLDGFELSVFTHVSDIKNCLELRDELLKSISISLHGRKPITLYSIVNGHEELTKTLTCSHILHLAKKRKAYLSQECLDVNHDMIFLIEDPTATTEYNTNTVNSITGNTEIRCRPEKITEYRKEIEETPKLEGYTVYHCRKSPKNENFILIEGNKCLLEDFFLDQYGESVYNLEKDIVPILGNNLRNIAQNYIPRFLCNALVSKSLFDSRIKGICFFSGNLSFRDLDIRKHMKDTVEDEMQFSEENDFIHVKSEDINNYWKEALKLKRPLLHIRVEGTDMHLCRCKGWKGLNDHISFSKQTIPEESFLTELTGEIIVLTGEPGIGKSSLLQSLFKNHSTEKYVLFYNLAGYKVQGKNRLLADSSLDFILNKIKNRRYCDFLSTLFKRKEKSVVLLDSFDEVLPDRKEEILNFIRDLTANNIQIIVASRLIANHILMDNFETNVYKVDILNAKSRMEYVKNCKFSEEMLTNIPSELLENPLYLKLLKSVSENGIHLRHVTKYAVFENIIRIKLNQYFDKYYSDHNSDKEHIIEHVLEIHLKFALVRIVGVGVVEKLFKWKRKGQLCNQVKLGIILSIDEDCHPRFVHETFAEYLTAEWIIRNIDKNSAKEIYLELLQQNKLYVLDILCEHLQLHKAVLELDKEKIEMYAKDPSHLRKTDALGRTALHVFAAKYRGAYECIQQIDLLLLTIICNMRKFEVNFTGSDHLMKWDWVQHRNQGNEEAYIRGLGRTNSLLVLEAHVNCIVQKLRAGVKLCIVDNLYYVIDIYGRAIKARNIDLIRDLFFIEDAALHGVSQASIHRAGQALETDEINIRRNRGFTALHVACIYGDEKVVSTLIKHDVNAIDNFGCTPLHYSVMNPHPKCVNTAKMLIERGSKVGVPNKWNDVAINIAVCSRNVDLAKLLLQKVDKLQRTEVVRMCLMLAMEREDRNMIELLLDHQPDANIIIKDSRTPLMIASESGSLDVVKLLLGKGASVNKKTTDGRTPLMIASENGSLDVAKLLLEKGAGVNRKTVGDETALMFASGRGSLDVANLLLDKGASVNRTTVDGETALMFASGRGSLDVANLLLDKGASVNRTTVDGETALMFASGRGSLDVAKLLIEKGSSVDMATIYNETALIFASESGSSGVTNLLLEAGANANNTTTDGRTPLMFAAKWGRVDVLRLLLEKGADVNNVTTEGKTLLMFASQSSCLDVVKLLLEKGVSVNSTTTDGRTPLMFAAKWGCVDNVKLLLEKGADVNNVTTDGETILMFAAKKGNSEIITLLLEKGVNVNSTTIDGKTPLMFACKSDNLAAVKLLLENGAAVNSTTTDGKTPLMFASETGMLDVMRLLLENGNGINSTTVCGKTPLIFSIHCSYYYPVKLLLMNGANINSRTTDGKTPLMLAIQLGHRNIVRLLLEEGADVNITTPDDKTPLVFSIEQSNLDAVEVLLDNGADVNNLTTNDRTPLFFAIKQTNVKYTKLLLRKGANVNAATIHGETPLMLACGGAHPNIVKILLKKGAQVNSTTTEGETPLFYAIKWGSTKVVKILLEKGADVNSTTIDGQTPLCSAIKWGLVNVVKLLLEHGANDIRTRRNGKMSQLQA